MHGLIFAGLRDYSLTRVGPHETARIWGEHDYLPTEAYGDDEFRARLEEVRKATGDSAAELERAFGVFAATMTFAGLYPDYYTQNDDTIEFLLGIEEQIHELVRATIRGARPPSLNVRPFGEVGVLVSYTSERRLCGLLAGLVEGVASHYGDALEIEQIQCMLLDDPGCVFTVVRAPETG